MEHSLPAGAGDPAAASGPGSRSTVTGRTGCGSQTRPRLAHPRLVLCGREEAYRELSGQVRGDAPCLFAPLRRAGALPPWAPVFHHLVQLSRPLPDPPPGSCPRAIGQHGFLFARGQAVASVFTQRHRPQSERPKEAQGPDHRADLAWSQAEPVPDLVKPSALTGLGGRSSATPERLRKGGIMPHILRIHRGLPIGRAGSCLPAGKPEARVEPVNPESSIDLGGPVQAAADPMRRRGLKGRASSPWS